MKMPVQSAGFLLKCMQSCVS